MFTSHPRHRNRLLSRSDLRPNRSVPDQNRLERLTEARSQGLSLISWSVWALLGLRTVTVAILLLMVMAKARLEALFRLAR